MRPLTHHSDVGLELVRPGRTLPLSDSRARRPHYPLTLRLHLGPTLGVLCVLGASAVAFAVDRTLLRRARRSGVTACAKLAGGMVRGLVKEAGHAAAELEHPVCVDRSFPNAL